MGEGEGFWSTDFTLDFSSWGGTCVGRNGSTNQGLGNKTAIKKQRWLYGSVHGDNRKEMELENTCLTSQQLQHIFALYFLSEIRMCFNTVKSPFNAPWQHAQTMWGLNSTHAAQALVPETWVA